MNFNTFKNLSDSKKICLFEIDQGIELNGTFWIKEESNIWKTTYAWDTNETRDFAYGIYVSSGLNSFQFFNIDTDSSGGQLGIISELNSKIQIMNFGTGTLATALYETKY